MKKILVTGAAGAIGYSLIKYLLSEGKYEITALDLKNKKVYSQLKRYRKRINIVYGDILDRNLIETLIKDTDVVIHLATCLPPFAELKKGLSDIIEYNGTENIVRAINYYNPKCHLIYASTTSLYGATTGSISNKIKLSNFEYYNNAKYNTEKLITKKINNYTIVRVPLLLTDLNKDSFIYCVDKNTEVEVITKEDAAYAFCKTLDNLSKINKKTLDIGGGETCQILYKDLISKIIGIHGITFKYINSSLFLPKTFYSPILLDSDESEKILKYRNDSIASYLMRQKRRSKNRKISKLIGKLFIKNKEVK